MFNPSNVNDLDIDLSDTFVTMPVLDSEILISECQIRKLKVDKANRPDGLCPGIFKVLPAQWVILITILYNVILTSGNYPSPWRLARLVTIFKHGHWLLPINYHGINVINVISKLHDMVLCNRIMQWFTPYREQAGGH